jgi:hypothetical protein
MQSKRMENTPLSFESVLTFSLESSILYTSVGITEPVDLKNSFKEDDL